MAESMKPVAWMDRFGEIFKSVEVVRRDDVPLYTAAQLEQARREGRRQISKEEREAIIGLLAEELNNPFSRDHNRGLQHAIDVVRARNEKGGA